jgi:hypothetical protein
MQVNTTEFNEDEGLPKNIIEARSQIEADPKNFDEESCK